MRMTTKNAAGLAAAALLAVPVLSACGTGDEAGAAEPNDNASASPDEQTTPEPVAQVDGLQGQSTAVVLDAGFVQALEQLKLTPGTVGDAQLADGAVSFPITGGDVTYYEPGSIDPYVQGEILHDGSGLSLTAGQTTVELTDFRVDPGTSQLFGDVSVNGESAAKDVEVFSLDGRTLQPLQTSRDGTAVLEGTKVMISEAAAPLLNDTFKTSAVKPGLLVGTAEITIDTE